GAVATVGAIEVEPGAANVIPGRVQLAVDVRAPDAERLTRLITEAGLDGTGRTEPVAMSDIVRAALRAEVEARGLPVVELASGAGRGAGVLATAGVASGLRLVRGLPGGARRAPGALAGGAAGGAW